MTTIVETDPNVRHPAFVNAATDLEETVVYPERLPSYPRSAFEGPLFEMKDWAAVVLAAIMMLGPLGALPLGYGG